MRVKTSDGIELQVYEFSEAGEPVLFLHPGGASSFVWIKMVPFFETRYRALAMDFRAFGQSDMPESGYVMERYVADIVEVLDAVGVERAHLVGNSLGADIATYFAAAHPERMLSLVNIDDGMLDFIGPNGQHEGTKDELIEQKRKRPRMEWASRAEFEWWAQENWLPWDEESEAYREHLVLYENPNGTWSREEPKEIGVQLYAMYCDYQFAPLYDSITCPVLFLPAATEPGLDRKLAFCQGIANSKTVVIPESRHIPLFAQAREFSDVILQFLKECSTS